MLTRDNMEIDLKDLNQLCCALDAIRFYQKSKGIEDDALQNQALKEASEKLSKLDNLRIVLENELMRSKGNLSRVYALQFALDELRKVLD